MIDGAIKDKILSVFGSGNGKYIEITIQIEMPLLSGIKVTAVATTLDGKQDISISGLRDFFTFAQQYKKANPKPSWNIMTIRCNEAKVFKLLTKFDSKLQQDAEDAVK